MGTKNKQYSAEFKQDAVNYYYSSGKSIKDAAEDLKISTSGLNNWIQNAKKNDGIVDHRVPAIIRPMPKRKLQNLRKNLKTKKMPLIS